ncbi:MAG: hypothetical protein EXQ93_06890 [Alphaproteobacteria bacterium]|nr:hypothetical protein [Alphaproteobacteria bacterium]
MKVVVIGLGAVIVIGLGILLVAIGREVAGARAKASFDPTQFALPAGARVLEMDLDGDRLAVRLDLGDGRQAIQMFDARSGAVLGVIALQ